MLYLVYVGIFPIGNYRDTLLQVLYVVVQAVGSGLYLFTLVVPFLYLFGVGLVVGIQFACHDLVSVSRVADGGA